MAGFRKTEEDESNADLDRARSQDVGQLARDEELQDTLSQYSFYNKVFGNKVTWFVYLHGQNLVILWLGSCCRKAVSQRNEAHYTENDISDLGRQVQVSRILGGVLQD